MHLFASQRLPRRICSFLLYSLIPLRPVAVQSRPYASISSLAFLHRVDSTNTHRAMTVTTRRSIKKETVVSKTLSTRRKSTALLAEQQTSDSTSTPNKRRKKKVKATTDVKEGQHNIVTPSTTPPPPQKARQKSPTCEPGSSCKPPDGWEDIYNLVVELRQDRTAPCDGDGAEALPDRHGSPKAFRFQVLISLMLSSQTKDATVGAAIRSMQQDNVLDVNSISNMSLAELNQYINKVGFHNNKTKYIKQVVEILKNKYDGDIPPTAAEMMELPGVGPKMAYIGESIAWNTQSGIGVDTHMHRLFNVLRWVHHSKNPEQTRIQLEAWLPRDKWGEVNLLWVGFGQEVQQFKPKMLRKALDCSRPAVALRLLKRCGLDYNKEGKKLGLQVEIQNALAKEEDL